MKRKYPGAKKDQRPRVRPRFFRASNPFADLSDEQREAASKAFAGHYEAEYARSFAELRAKLDEVDPIQTLCHFAFYDLTLFGRYPDSKSDYEGAGQHHVELLQALLLTIPEDDQPPSLTTTETFLEIGRLVIRVSEAFTLRRFYPTSTGSEGRYFQALSEDARIHTQAIRNWGYPEQVFRILTDMFGLLDAEWAVRRGFKISNLVKMCQNIFRLVEDRFERRKKLARPVLKAKTVREAVETYYRTVPGIVGQSADFLDLIKKADLGVDGTKAALMTHFDLSLRDCYTFSIGDFRHAFPEPISEEGIENVLADWSISIGALDGRNPEHFFLANPVWTKPIIRLADQRFCWPVLELFLSFGLEMMQGILKQEPDLYREYEEVTRPHYLEEKVATLFETAFPAAQILRGSMWREPDSSAPYENDLLICLDSYLIVVESKSGKVDAAAKRGGDRLKKTLTKLIVVPTIQADRFARFLLETRGPHEFDTKRGVRNQCDTSAATRIIRLNITFELLGPLSAQRTMLQKANLMAVGIPAAVTMALTDLEIVFELLPLVHEKLHYLERRAEFEHNANYTADEIDLLAFYLETGFNIGEDEYEGKNSFHLYGQSKVFDSYFLGKNSGGAALKPKLKLTDKWRRILIAMEERRFKGWTQLGVCLLNVSFADQQLFERRLKKVVANVRSRWHDPSHENTLILENGPPQRREAIVGYAYKRISREARNRMLNVIISTAAAETGADRVAVIGVDCDEPSVPYSVLAFVPSIKLDTQ
jgi:hypothetical protein